jgi:hypothetical protein
LLVIRHYSGFVRPFFLVLKAREPSAPEVPTGLGTLIINTTTAADLAINAPVTFRLLELWYAMRPAAGCASAANTLGH